MSYNAPVECGLSKPAVDRLASNIAKQIGYDPGADLSPIVSRLGGKIVLSDLWQLSDSTSGSIRIEESGSFTIALASHTGAERDRFTIAHELGHYVLHFLWHKQHGKSVGAVEAMRYGTGRVEWEANWFAAGFLMPADIFTNSWKEANGVISSVAAHFGVSVDATRIRAETLGLM